MFGWRQAYFDQGSKSESRFGKLRQRQIIRPTRVALWNRDRPGTMLCGITDINPHNRLLCKN
jgi:hypothetical protein